MIWRVGHLKHTSWPSATYLVFVRTQHRTSEGRRPMYNRPYLRPASAVVGSDCMTTLNVEIASWKVKSCVCVQQLFWRLVTPLLVQPSSQTSCRERSLHNGSYFRAITHPEVRKVGPWGLPRSCALATMFSFFWSWAQKKGEKCDFV